MATRLVARSRTLALALSRADAPQPIAGARALSSLPRHLAAAAPPPAHGKVLGYEQFLPRWFSTVASNGSPMQKSQIQETSKSAAVQHADVLKVTEIVPPTAVAFSPLESAIAKPRISPLMGESSKVKKSELATLVTFYMIPGLLLASKNSYTTSLMVAAVFHQVYMFHKEILLDYVHHDITRKWALIYFKLLLLIMAKDTIVYFSFV